MTRVTRLLLTLFAISTAGTAAAQNPVSGPAATADPGQGLSPGDQIRIIVWRKPEFSGDFPISANGTISHPLYREIQVTGVPLSVVEDRLRTFLTRYETSPQFVIQPLMRVVVGGEVRNPNILSVPPETTIAQAIFLAGGPTERGLLDKVKLIRDRQEIALDISRPDADVTSLQIRSGDEILVGRRGGRSTLEVIGPLTSTIAAAAAIVTIFRR
jgi:protein involved in polysaccharide export with SLBB domain